MSRVHRSQCRRWFILVLAACGLLYSGCALRAKSRVHWALPAGRSEPAPLFVRTLGQSGPPILLLHGLLGSGRYWGAAFYTLAADHRLVVPDLLGFGESPKPATGYSADEHAEAVAATLDAVGVSEPVVIGSHSLGGLIALRFAALYPRRVRAVVAFGPPLFSSPEAARRGVVRTSPMGRLLAFDSPLARRSCIWFHRHAAASVVLTRLLRPDLPGAVARDTVKHTWESYWQTLEQMILPAQGENWLREAAAPVRLVLGSKDQVADFRYLEEIAARYPHVSLLLVRGAGHDLPLTRPDLCVAEIRRTESSALTGDGQPRARATPSPPP